VWASTNYTPKTIYRLLPKVTLDTVATVLPSYSKDQTYIYTYAEGVQIMLCDSKPEDIRDGKVRSSKNDIMCDFEKRKAFRCKDASKCDLLDVNTASNEELLNTWIRIGLFLVDPIFFYKTVSSDSLRSQACTPYAEFTATSFEYIFIVNKGDFACGIENRQVFQCKVAEEGRCYNTDPNTDINEYVWNLTRFKPSPISPTGLPTIYG